MVHSSLTLPLPPGVLSYWQGGCFLKEGTERKVIWLEDAQSEIGRESRNLSLLPLRGYAEEFDFGICHGRALESFKLGVR